MTIITDDNIPELVRWYVDGEWDQLPDDLSRRIGEWDVSRVTSMNGLFSGCDGFNEPIGGWNVTNVTDMNAMFYNASSFNQDIGGWIVSNVTDMSSMFYNAARFNQDIGRWNVSNVKDNEYMFNGAASFNQNLSRWTFHTEYDARIFEGSAMTPNNYPRFLLLDDGELSPVAPVAPFAPVAPVPLINASTGSLHHNLDYKPALLPAPQFSVSKGRVYRDSTYYDLIDGEDKRVLDALAQDPTAIAFKTNNAFYVISAGVLTKLMNEPDFIKYECLKVKSMANIERSVPYLSMNSIGIPSQGAVPLFDLWTAVHSGNRTYELVKTARLLLSTVSHNVLYNQSSHVSAAHCQDGQDAYVYELRILPVDSRSKASATATRIQSAIRGHQSRARAQQTIKSNARTKARTKARTNALTKARTKALTNKARSWSWSSNQRSRTRTRRSKRHSAGM
jgi:surface protein